MPKGHLVIEYTDCPKMDGFSIKVPPGTYSRAELMDLIWFEYQWQCDEAPKRQIVIPIDITD